MARAVGPRAADSWSADDGATGHVDSARTCGIHTRSVSAASPSSPSAKERVPCRVCRPTRPSGRALCPLERKRYARIPEVLPIPDLIELQLRFVPTGSSTRACASSSTRSAPSRTSPARSWSCASASYEFGEPKYYRARVPHARPDLRQAALRVTSSCSSRRPARSRSSASSWATSRS